MAISGDYRIFAALDPYRIHSFRFPANFPYTKTERNAFVSGKASIVRPELVGGSIRCNSKRDLGKSGQNKLSGNPISQEVERFVHNAINMNLFERLNLAWKIIFPSPPTSPMKNSNAGLAKHRLKMILFSDRGAVSDEAKQKIVTSIVSVLSNFVEIESWDKVQLSVTTDADLGTIYSVIVPVRRVRSEYQVGDEDGSITNIEYRDRGGSSGSVDVQFDFYIREDRFEDFSA